MFSGEETGIRIDSGGMAGRADHSNCPKSDSHSFVKMRVATTPPLERMKSRARFISSRSGSTPASLRAK